MTLLTTAQAAARLGITDSHVRRLIIAKRLKATRHGERAWLIEARALGQVKLRPAGRQKQSRTDGGKGGNGK
jgi:excisionase family DNA binding protein